MSVQLQQIQLVNFRNHTELEVALAPVTAITGPNGSGKTSILEAISLLSVTRSWKTERDNEVVQWEAPFSRIVADGREFVIQRNPATKRYRIDGVPKRLTEVLGNLPTVVFQPEDSEIVFGSPTYRRQMIDRLLSQVEPGYARALLTLQRVLKQRNRLLKQIQEAAATEEELPYWDDELAQTSEVIQTARERVIAEIGRQAAAQFATLMPHVPLVELHYHRSPTHVAEGMVAHLQANRAKEIAAGTSLYGPHREDILVHFGGHNADEAMSRGQARALVLAIKLAEIAYVEAKTDVPPILLLDDIFAEFDAERRERILALCGTYQTIYTCTDVEAAETLLKNSHVVTLKNS